MRKRKKQFRWKCTAFALVLGASLFAAGCGSKDDSSEKEDAVQQDAKADAEDVSTDKTEDTAIDSAVEKAENTLTEKTENTPTPVPATPTEVPGLEFPQKVDGEKLLVESLFQYSGINPDYQDEMCEDAASIQITNCSKEYLESSQVSVELRDGTVFVFQVEDIPAGETALAFDVQNQTFDGKTPVEKIDAESEYSTEASLREDVVSITTDESGIHLNNISGEDLTNMIVEYHCNLDGMYFGGVSYEGMIESLTSGDSTVLETPECYLGEAAVVNIVLK